MPDPLLDRVVAALGDRFEVGDELGRGGMAVVYRAREVRLRRPVALKVLPPELAFRSGVRERFLREAQTAAQLTHPHVVPIYAADETAGVAWLAMALVDGETLGQRMARAGRASPDEARRILAEVADALAYAHAHGVVHRDVKPDNILLDRESGRATVTDFGIARAAEEELRLTVTGVAIGSPAYMSPEQAMGEAALDGRSDQYSLAVVGYQLLTGELPFQAASATGMLMKHVAEAPRPIAALRPEVPAALAAAIERALAKKPADRWPDAVAFRRALLDPRAGSASEPFTVIVPALEPPPRPAPREPQLREPQPREPRDVRDALAAALEQADRALADSQPLRAARPAPPPAEPEPPRPSPGQWRETQKQTEREWKEHLREQRREWKDRRQEQREHLKDQREGLKSQLRLDVSIGRAGPPFSLSRGEVPGNAPLGGMPMGGLAVPGQRGAPWGAAPIPELPLDRRAELFRRKAKGVIGLLIFLTIVNAIHLFIPPWVIFPAWGMIGDLRRRWRPLRDEGLVFSELMLEGAQVAVAGAAVRPARRRPRSLEQRARRFRRRAKQLGFMLSAAMLAFGVALASGEEGFFGVMMIPLLASLLLLVGALRNGRHVSRAGMTWRETLGDGWEARVAAIEPRPREEVLAEEATRLASASVLGGPYGAVLRGALDDRLVVQETLAKLSPADRALIPDVRPTVDALVDRVAGLVQSLSRLEGDVRPGAVEELDARLAQARREPPHAPDRDRKVALLERQRASVADLAHRRATMLAQLESAQLVLQNVKLDLLKLRASGVGALAEVTTATQEARALSRDIQYALDAAAEVRAR
jgi:serine/threonine-protein kinase